MDGPSLAAKEAGIPSILARITNFLLNSVYSYLSTPIQLHLCTTRTLFQPSWTFPQMILFLIQNLHPFKLWNKSTLDIIAQTSWSGYLGTSQYLLSSFSRPSPLLPDQRAAVFFKKNPLYATMHLSRRTCIVKPLALRGR